MMSQNPLIGRTLRNRYKIVKLLGSGGFGHTYLAVDSDLPGKPECVVKQFKPNNLAPQIVPVAERLFEREAQSLYRLGNHHDQIPRLFAHFEENEEFYLVQEFIDGHDLIKEILPGMPWRESEVLKLLQEILEVLAFVHQNNVIHRDIKPENLRRRRKDNLIVLIDFGAVKEISTLKIEDLGQSRSTVAIGTPGYMPSEQQSSYPHFSSDVYAVGILGLQALTGLYPQQFPRDTYSGEFSCALFKNNVQVSRSFAEVLDTMVRYDYRQRYQDATVALAAIRQVINFHETPTIIPIPPESSPISESSPLPESGPLPESCPLPEPQPNLTSPFKRIFQALWQPSVLNQPTNSQPTNSQPTNSQQPKIITNQRAFLERPEGPIALDDSVFYVERPTIENDCYETIVKPGALIRIKAPRQMGKTSLLLRILDQASQKGCKTASLNFHYADAEFFTDLDKFLQWFSGSITQELNLTQKLNDYWQGFLGSKNNCTNYFQRYLLSEIDSPLLLGLDDVDQVFQHAKIATDFFGLLRAWHEKSKNEAIWKRLRLVIVHSKEVYIPLNINQSPFNVGLPIELPELNESQVGELVKRYNLNWTQAQVQQIMAMLGGQPYLVRRALYEIARGRMTLKQVLETASNEDGMYSDYLRRHLSNLQEDTDLMTALKQVIASPKGVRIETNLAFKLRSMGLVKFQGNDVIPLCDMYRNYFGDRLKVG